MNVLETDQILPLTTHHVTDGKAPGLVRTPGELRSDIRRLKDSGYTFLTATQTISALATNTLSDRTAVLTFDDGLRTQYDNAVPILEEFDVPATFFIISSTLEGRIPPVMILQTLLNRLGAPKLNEILQEKLPAVFKALLRDEFIPLHKEFKGPEADDVRPIKFVFNSLMPPQLASDILSQIFKENITDQTEEELAREWFMSIDNLKQLQDQGFEVGSHTLIHPLLYLLSFEQIQDQLVVAQQQIENATKGKPESFAYPFGGQFSTEIVALVAEYYTSGWNYAIQMPTDFQRSSILKNPHDIARVEGALFMNNRQ